MPLKIDLNCDMGEGCGNDAELMDFVSSINVACGFHAGDTEIMSRTVEMALKKGVAIGAHPGYRDRKSFGRVAMGLLPEQIFEIVSEQVMKLSSVCVEFGATLRHVKPHGALYNQAAKDPEFADAVARAVREQDETLILFGLSGSASIREARKIGLSTASEAFADRTYQEDGSLTPRIEPTALITDTQSVLAQVLQIVKTGTVTSAAGVTIPLMAETICVHGDGPHAVGFAYSISHELKASGIRIEPV